MGNPLEVCDICDALEIAGKPYPCRDCAEIEKKGDDPRCQLCTDQRVIGPWIDYQPPYAMRELGNTFPEIEWLANLPTEERAWHAGHLEHLVERYPNVPEWAWVKLLRKPNGSGRS